MSGAGSPRSCLVPLLRLVGPRLATYDLGEIGHGRPRPQRLEHVIAARAHGELGHPGRALLEIAEADGLGRAGLLAGRLDVAVLDRAPRLARIVLALLDALDAHGALLHDAELAHGDVGIQLLVEGRRPRVVEPVEAADVIRAVVAAVPRAHAAVIDLRVEAFLRVVGGVDGTDGLARRHRAMLAEHGQEHVGLPALPLLPSLEADPLLGAAVGDLGLAHHGDVVLGRAGDHAGLAARAGVHVHRHPPAVVRILDGGIHAGNARALRRFAAQLHLACRGEADDLRDLTVLVVEGRLWDGERTARACAREAHLHREMRQPARGRLWRGGAGAQGARSAVP